MKKPIRPIHICLFIAACLAVLALTCALVPTTVQIGAWELRFPQLATIWYGEQENEENSEDLFITEDILPKQDTVSITVDSAQEVVVPAETHIVAQQLTKANDTLPITTSSPIIPEEDDSTDTRIYLSSFYAALLGVADEPIRVVHYGDSQIEEDRLSMQVRRALQTQYGGGGVGLIPLHQTIGTRTSWQSLTMGGQVQKISGGPKRYLAYGPTSYQRKGGVYGPMGQVAIMDNNLVAGSEDMTLQFRAGVKQPSTESYFNRIRVWKKGDIMISIHDATDRQGDMFILPDSTTSVTIQLDGKGEVYGISMEQSTGVMVDNIPMRGASGAVFTLMASDELSSYYRKTNTRLIILQFGGNVMPYTSTQKQVLQYVDKMRTQIQYLKYLAPNSSLLFVGPSDMCELRDGQLRTFRMLPMMDKALKQMAIEEEIGYFSMFHAMGGAGSMQQWCNKGWAGSDYIHFTPKGAEKAGQLLADWIINMQ